MSEDKDQFIEDLKSILKLNMDDVKCLIMHPENTEGYRAEAAAIWGILQLCDEHGYGRIPQLAKHIEEIWRDNIKVEKFKKQRGEYLEMVKSMSPDPFIENCIRIIKED